MRGRGMSRRRSRHDHARRLRARRAAGKRQQRDVARPLDGHAQPALMPRANARHPPRQNLPALLHELRQDVRALVVDEVHLLDAELAHLFLAKILALASWPASGAARTPATRSAFASRTTVPAARTAVTTMTAGAAGAGAEAGVVRRGRRAARFSRFCESFFWRFKSSSRRTV